MRLSACVKVHGCERPIDRPGKGGNVDLRQVYIRLTGTVSAGQRLPVDDGQFEREGDIGVDATLDRSRVYERVKFR